MKPDELGQVFDKLKGLWWEPSREEWREWSARLQGFDLDMALASLSRIWEAQDAKRQPTWKRFEEAYAQERLARRGERRPAPAPSEAGDGLTFAQFARKARDGEFGDRVDLGNVYIYETMQRPSARRGGLLRVGRSS